MTLGFPSGSMVKKKSACNTGVIGDSVLISGLESSPGREGMVTHSVSLPGESHGQRSLVGNCPRVAKSWTWLKRLSTHKMTLSKFGLKEESSTYRYKINIIYSQLMMVLTANLYLRIYHMLSDLDIFCHFLSQILFYCFKNRKVDLKWSEKIVDLNDQKTCSKLCSWHVA